MGRILKVKTIQLKIHGGSNLKFIAVFFELRLENVRMLDFLHLGERVSDERRMLEP
jgi:hypothetical protein